MQMKYTEEKLNTFSKETLIQLFLTQQEQLSEIDGKLQLVLEQLAVMNQNRFGRKTEQMPVPEQLAFTDVDGELVLFNEAEVLAALDEREKETTVKKRPVKKKGKREEDLSGIPVVKVEHYLTEKELEDLFGKAGWKQLPDEIYKRYRFIPAKVEVEEHHVGVYASKEGDTMKKAPHPACLLRGSLVSPSLEAAVLNGKYINAVPLPSSIIKRVMDTMSSPIVHSLMYCLSSFTTSSKSVMLLRPLTCHIPVSPGLVARRAR